MGFISGVTTTLNTNSATTKTGFTNLSSNTTGAPIGCIFAFVGVTLPSDMLLCDGSAVSRTTYSELFSVIGTYFGAGNGSSTFNLPDFITGNKIPVGKKTSVASINELGKSGGSLSHSHTGGAHQHSFTHTHTTPTHSHTYNHSHTMGNHTHGVSHSHSLANHTHGIWAHGHASITLNPGYSVGYHSHEIAGQKNTLNNDGCGNASTRNTWNDTSTRTSYTTSVIGIGSVGSGTDASVSNFTSGYPSTNSTQNTYNGSSNGPSTNNTSSVSGSTTSNSADVSLQQYTGNTGSGGTDVTTDSQSIPYVTVRYIIKAKNI